MGRLHSTRVLVRRAVRCGGLRLGEVADALLDHPLRRLVGFDVGCRDGVHRFLPFPACEVLDDSVEVESALVLLDRDLDFYRLGGSAFSDLEGQSVRIGGEAAGPLVDLLFSGEGDVRRVVASTPRGDLELDSGPGLVVGNHILRPAV
jgi:hypothetical protein